MSFKMSIGSILTITLFACFLSGIHGASKLWSSSETLNLHQNLKVFETCTVHIVYSYIWPYDISGRKILQSERYQLDPLNFPVIISEYVYYHNLRLSKRLPDGSKVAAFYCNGNQASAFQMFPEDGFYFQAHPPTLNCRAQLIIDPKPCSSWKVYEHIHNTWIGLFPTERMMPMIYFGTQGVKGGLKDIVQRNSFFIRVTKQFLEQPKHSSELYDVVDYTRFFSISSTESKFGPDLSTLMTKLLFIIKYDVSELEYRVEHSYLVDNINTDSVYLAFSSKICDTARETMSMNALRQCKSAVDKAEEVHLTPFAIIGMNIEKLQQLYMHIRRFDWQPRIWRMFRQLAKINTDNRMFVTPGESFYFMDWTHKNPFTLDCIILSLFSPNSTVILNTQTLIEIDMPVLFTYESYVTEGFLNYDTQGFHFLTCAPVEQIGKLSIKGFVSAFDITFWICLIVFTVLTGCCVNGLQTTKEYLLGNRKETTKWINMRMLQNFSFMYNLLLEQGTVTNCSKWILGTWLFVAIVLANAYKGDNITNLMAPFSIKFLERFEEIFERQFTFHSINIYHFRLHVGIFPSYDDFFNYTYYSLGLNESELLETGYMSRATNIITVQNILLNGTVPEVWSKFIAERIKRPKDGQELFEMSKDGYIVDQIGNCGMDVYIDKHDSVYKMYLDIKVKLTANLRNDSLKEVTKRKLKYLTYSKEMYGDRMVGETWGFSGIPWTAQMFLVRVRAIVESGLVNKWAQWGLRIDTWEQTLSIARNTVPSLKELGMGDNVVVVFYLYLTFILIAIIAFFYEKRGVFIRETNVVTFLQLQN